MAALVLALAVRLAWALAFDVKPMHECAWYLTRATELAAGNGYTVNGVPTAYWPVGFPAFLGAIFFAFGPSLLVAKLANVVISTLTVALAGVVARHVYRSELAAVITMLFLASYPNIIAYVSIISSETLFLFLVLCGMAAMILAKGRWWVLAISGLAFGLATLTRPQAVLIPVIGAATVLLADSARAGLRQRILESVVVCLAVAAVLTPWTLRNYRLFGHFVFVSTNGGVNLLIGNHPDATGNYVLTDRMIQTYKSGADEYQQDRLARSAVVGYIRHEPAAALALWPKKLFALYRWTGSDGIEHCRKAIDPARREQAAILKGLAGANEIIYRMLWGFFLVAICVLPFCGQNRREVLLAMLPGLSIIAYLTVVHLAFFGSARYHFPMIPWMAMQTAALPAALVANLRLKRNPDIEQAVYVR